MKLQIYYIVYRSKGGFGSCTLQVNHKAPMNNSDAFSAWINDICAGLEKEIGEHPVVTNYKYLGSQDV